MKCLLLALSVALVCGSPVMDIPQIMKGLDVQKVRGWGALPREGWAGAELGVGRDAGASEDRGAVTSGSAWLHGAALPKHRGRTAA